ncbi:MAG TPA: HAD family hydrolase [Rhizomicrobium sp.]|jgi:putative hydrolase of the HAD superfamily|nr:HAD family hydrolase [Rhizomicrobium sp.]
MPKFPRAILFDLDDTIISAYGRPEAAWEAVLGEFTDVPDKGAALAAISAAARDFWADAERHRVWRQTIRAARREIVARGFARLAADGKQVPDPAIQARIADRFSDYRNENLALFPDAHATIDGLRAAGVKLALITNGAAEPQRAKVVRFALTERFDHIQIEGEHGFGKPEERAYRHALAALGVDAKDAWIVGDNLEWEVIAPQKLGLFAIWHDPHGDGLPAGHAARPDRIIRRLSALLA